MSKNNKVRGDILISELKDVELKELIYNNFELYVGRLREYYGIDIGLTNVFFFKKGQKAGQARCVDNIIRLNLGLINKNEEYFKEMTTDTLAHELCHIFIYKKHKNAYLFGDIKAHGREWKEAMKVCGFPNASTTHSMTITPARKRKRLRQRVECDNCSKIFHFMPKNISNIQYYRCNFCSQDRGTLTPLKEDLIDLNDL